MSDAIPPQAPGPVAAIAREDGLLLRRWLGAWIDFVALAAPVAVIILLELAFSFALTEAASGVAVILWFVYMMAYFPVSEGLWGRTAGKLLTGTVVLTADGDLPGFWRALVRTVLRVVEVNPLLLGGIPAGLFVLFTRNHQRLGDMAAGTYVIPISRWPAARGARLAQA